MGTSTSRNMGISMILEVSSLSNAYIEFLHPFIYLSFLDLPLRELCPIRSGMTLVKRFARTDKLCNCHSVPCINSFLN